MRDFPPLVTTFWSPEGEPVGEAPDTRSPLRFLRWILRQQGNVVAVAIMFGVLWQLPLIAGPWIFGRAIDAGVVGGDPGAVAAGAGALFVVTLIGAVFGILLHTLVVRSWLISLYGTTMAVTRKAAQMGQVLPRRSPTGEILSVASSDSDEFGAMTEIIARAGSQLVSFLAVTAIVMAISPRLGMVVLVAAPILVGVALPFLRPLHRSQELERSRNSELTSMATDIVA
jgi:ABC-type multidrug transport system fused ATPase/permease subunit